MGETHERRRSQPAEPIPEQPDIVVRWLVWALSRLQHWILNLPRAQLARLVGGLRRDAEPWVYLNYIYVAIWLALLIVIWIVMGLISRPSVGALVLAAIALWRYAEILVWYLKALLDDLHREMWSFERNFVFLVLDVTAMVTIIALLYRTGGEKLGAFDSWLTGLSTFTLNLFPDRPGGVWPQTAALLGTFGGLLLLGAGLALIVGLIAQRFRKSSTSSEYTGPRVAPRPTRDWPRRP